MNTPTEKPVKAAEAKQAAAPKPQEITTPHRTSRGGVVACDADGEDLHDDDENKNWRD